MGGEHHVGTQVGHALDERASAKPIRTEQLQASKHRVAFIKMIEVRLATERAKQSHAAHAKHDFLSQSVRLITSVKSLGDPTIF